MKETNNLFIYDKSSPFPILFNNLSYKDMSEKKVFQFKNIFQNFQYLLLDTIMKWCLPILSSQYEKRISKFYMVIDLNGSDLDYIIHEVHL